MTELAVSGETLDMLASDAFDYFRYETNGANGLVRDKTRENWPASIAATGLGLSAYCAAAERGYVARGEALDRALATLRFFHASRQGPEPNATGHRGFYYHFLDMETGARAWRSELSTIDTALLVAGMLTAAAYFDRDDEEEAEVRRLADALYRRVDWAWALDGGATLTHGWRPERGFLPYRWCGYDEALVLYLLALGSPTHAVPPESYDAWVSSYAWRRVYGVEYLYSGPLFTHQFSHQWVDFRGIRDRFMREHDADYFENSRRATLVQREYAIRNPRGFRGYHANCWGLTACEGPGPGIREVDGRRRRFYDYTARGVPFGPDDGTLAPWAVVASLPFAPEVVAAAIEHFVDLDLHEAEPYGFKATFNPTFRPDGREDAFWVSPHNFGINQGPIVVMIENYRSGLVWRLMRTCPYLVAGLRRAGFAGGWLEGAD